MEKRPRIGSYAHGEAYPRLLSIYNADYNVYPPYTRECEFPKPWNVDRGMETLKSFTSFEHALDYVRERLDEALLMEVS
jgi:hypothetical protein